jgi:hypothetical protein
VSLPASLHVLDALYGLAIGAVAAVATVVLTVTAHRPRWSIVAGLAVASLAGIAAMYAARAVRMGIVEDIDTPTAIVVVAVGLSAGAGWASLHRHLRLPWTTALLFVTAAGVWAAVPDTETAVAVIAAWLPFAVLVAISARTPPHTPAKLASPGTHSGQRDANFARHGVGLGWCGLGCVLAWAAAWGTDGRVEARPGTWACFGVAIVAAGFSLARRPLPPAHIVGIVAVATVVAASRWAAQAPSTETGLVRAAVVLATCAGVMILSARRDEPAHPPPSDPVARPR